ncbi:hypothetical protein HC761_00135 [bacterium]|nr:hypothetical protein [bacterium]
MSKPAALSKLGGLVSPKGGATPAIDASQRGSQPVKDEKMKTAKDEIVNLSFKVPNEFRKRFKLAAINAGITQNELVVQALQAWEKR